MSHSEHGHGEGHTHVENGNGEGHTHGDGHYHTHDNEAPPSAPAAAPLSATAPPAKAPYNPDEDDPGWRGAPFSKVLYIVPLHSKCNRALTLKNFCRPQDSLRGHDE
jgi:hypothetical protein